MQMRLLSAAIEIGMPGEKLDGFDDATKSETADNQNN